MTTHGIASLAGSGRLNVGTTANKYITTSQEYSIYAGVDPVNQLRNNCTELYKQTLFYHIKKYHKDPFTEQQHINMFSMLESNDKDTLELLRQILVSKTID